MPTFLRVRAVEDRMLLDPRSITSTDRKFVGYRKVEDGEAVDMFDPRSPRRGVRRVDLYSDEIETVPADYPDWYFQKAIRDGELEYIETVSDPGSVKEKVWLDAALVAQSAKHARKLTGE